MHDLQRRTLLAAPMAMMSACNATALPKPAEISKSGAHRTAAGEDHEPTVYLHHVPGEGVRSALGSKRGRGTLQPYMYTFPALPRPATLPCGTPIAASTPSVDRAAPKLSKSSPSAAVTRVLYVHCGSRSGSTTKSNTYTAPWSNPGKSARGAPTRATEPPVTIAAPNWSVESTSGTCNRTRYVSVAKRRAQGGGTTTPWYRHGGVIDPIFVKRDKPCEKER